MIEFLTSAGDVARYSDLTFLMWLFASAVTAGMGATIIGLVVYQFGGPQDDQLIDANQMRRS